MGQDAWGGHKDATLLHFSVDALACSLTTPKGWALRKGLGTEKPRRAERRQFHYNQTPQVLPVLKIDRCFPYQCLSSKAWLLT